MSKLPTIEIQQSQVYIGHRNDKGQLCNIYSPLQNFVDSKTQTLGDFTTNLLNFDMEHPVDILVQDAYDGAVNLIINDNKNKPRLINSRFSVQDENTFKLTDHIGFKDSNVYSEDLFNVDTLLKQIPIKIPIVEYIGLENNGGKLPVGSYTFYFKLVDVDGNETEVIQESGIVQCHIGDINTSKIRMGLQDENSTKSVRFKLSNLDFGFHSVRVLFERRSSSADQAVVATYHKILFDYTIDSNGTCNIEITGAEQIIGISKEELYVDYADINSVQTQTVANNILLFANTKQAEHDWEELKRISWKIIPTCCISEPGSIGSLTPEYQDAISDESTIKDHGMCYFNTRNTYYRVGYWPEEIYRFGIVYIFEDNSLSPVLDIQGIDFTLLDNPFEVKVLESDEAFPKPTNYSKLFFIQGSDKDIDGGWTYPCHLYENEDGYFNNKYKTNSRGAIRFPKADLYEFDSASSAIIPKPMYIKFDLSLIGYERATIHGKDDYDANNKLGGDFPTWSEVLKKHHIKGYFFVRQKRTPITIAQGVVIGLSDKDHGAVPVLKSIDNKYIGQSFLNKYRLIDSKGTTFKIPRSKTDDYKNQAMLVPDAELHPATFNNIFTSQEYLLEHALTCTFNQQDETIHYCDNLNFIPSPDQHLVKLTNVPDGTKLLTNGVDFFSARAGSAEEAFKTEDLIYAFNKTVPQDLTASTSVIRGEWGSYVGMSNPYYNSKNDKQDNQPFEYGQIYNIKTKAIGKDDEGIDTLFKQVLNSVSPYFAISHRTELKQTETCFRGDCYINMFTHRMNRNFIDPELPTNTKIVNPDSWAQNYAVRCTASITSSGHSNLTKDNDGWFIGPDAITQRKKELKKQALINFLTLNFIGGIIALTKVSKDDIVSPEDLGLGDSYINPTKVIQKKTTIYVSSTTGDELTDVSKDDVYYKLTSVENSNNGYVVTLEVDENGVPIKFNMNDTSQLYPNGYANEIVQAFEVYVGPSKRKNPGGISSEPNTDLALLTLKYDTHPTRKKVNPREQEQNASGFNLKALFKSNDNWELHGTASINRADVNAVGLGQWITFPIMSSTNLQMRDVDFSQATEEAKFNKKRSFYPLQSMDMNNPLADSNVINGAASCCLADKQYHLLSKTPFFKQEYFTRIYNSFRDSSNSITNQFRLILQNAYYDYTKTHGSITKIIAKGNYVYVIFAHGIGILDMSQVQDTSALNFLPPIGILNSDIGSIWKDSIIDTDQGIFGVDSIAKKIWQIQGTQLTVISDMKVQKFLNDNLDMSEFVFRPYVGHINIKTHYNKFKEDVMFTYYNDLLWKVPTLYQADKYSVDSEGIIIEKLKDGKTERVLSNGNLVKAEQLLPNWDDHNEKWKSYSDLINELDSAYCHKWSKGLEWSLCYNLRLGQFVTFYDWIPLESENIDNIYFSFDRDGIDFLQQQIYTQTAPILISEDKEYEGISINMNKHLIDKAFTNTIKSYHIKSDYGCRAMFKSDSTQTFVCYLYNPGDDDIPISIKSNDVDSLTLTPRVYKLLIVPNIDQITLSSKSTYIICDPKFVNIAYGGTLDSNHNYTLRNIDELRTDLYEFRNSDNSLPLWKHGQAGVYDNQGEIKPTNWYGKQREFNFEFVVNEQPQVQKLFNNLLLISNKTEPNKFEYEIVGQGYEWWPYKSIVFWANDKIKSGEFLTLDDAYKYILSNDVKTIRTRYPDFPQTELEYKAQRTNNPYKYKKLPYLTIELTDRQGRQDKSYNPYDKWSTISDTRDQLPRSFDYTFNTNETVIKYDKQLNEYRVHDEQLGNDMWKYGRIRGNMQYLEDLWKVEIRPLAFQWCYLNNDNEVDKKKITETRHRDKYIKIKIRYSGEDLAVIQAVGTLLDESRA